MDNQENRSRFDRIPPEEYKFDPYTGKPIDPADNPYAKKTAENQQTIIQQPVVQIVNEPVKQPVNGEEPVDKNGMTAKDRATALAWCLLSIGLQVLPALVYFVLATISEGTVMEPSKVYGEGISNMVSSIGEFIVFGAAIAGLVLMILTRVKYPKYTFGLVLMIVYLVEFTLFIIFTIMVLIACNIFCGSCLFGTNSRGCW